MTRYEEILESITHEKNIRNIFIGQTNGRMDCEGECCKAPNSRVGV